MSAPDWYNMIAAKRGMPDGWRWCEVRVVGDRASGGILMSGGVPRVLKSGQNKGTKTFRGVERNELLVTTAQLLEAKQAWEAETGQCYECGGTRVVTQSWSSATGRLTRPCTRCGGTGAKP